MVRSPSAATALDCVHHVVERQVDRAPDAAAAYHDGAELTYGELDERANRFAWELIERGVRRGDRVGLCLRRTPDMIVAVLAVLKTGAAYVPLDPAYPAARLAFMIEDSGVRLCVASREHAPPEATEVLSVEEWDAAGRPPGRPDVPVGPSDLAYIIYTSGSTGRPKGVAIEHRSTCARMRWVQTAFSEDELSGVLASTSLSFDVSVFEILGALGSGGRLVLVPDVLSLPWLPANAGVRLVSTVPSAMSELLAADGLPPSVVTVCLAGEAVTPDLAARVQRLPHVRRTIDAYGPTEDTTYSTWYEIPPGAVPRIGTGLPGSTTYVLGPDGAPVTDGEVGELHLGGDGLARGYVNRPAETALRFVPDPFDAAPGARMYRTGDRVVRLPGGDLHFVGRVDSQVKVRGRRIELGEVTAALTDCDGIRDAVVSVGTDHRGDACLVAHIVTTRPGVADATVRENLARRLPDHMVPTTLIRLAALPVLPNGKVDRTALPPG